MLAAWAVHDQRGRDAQEVVRAVVEVIEAAPDAQLREAMLRAMMSMLSDPLVAVIRETMMNPNAIPASSAYLALRRDIEAIAEARALLAVLAARKLTVDVATRERIERCSDPEMLERWITSAATATTLGEVFDAAVDAR